MNQPSAPRKHPLWLWIMLGVGSALIVVGSVGTLALANTPICGCAAPTATAQAQSLAGFMPTLTPTATLAPTEPGTPGAVTLTGAILGGTYASFVAIYGQADSVDDSGAVWDN
ncbi:MAG TPA: hypothetical protein VKQ36_04025, partial [Ktedonobacterales bacterium]|nr:hypothetical protein [Ktedonobacterales bacterium]